MSGLNLKPAAELARNNGVRFPNESSEYRRARDQLLVEEIELRRHIERVAELRRALPPGCAVTKDYAFEGDGGKATLPDLFGDKQTLVIYSYMFGPDREQPCPMCTSFMSTWEGKIPDIQQRIAFVFVARAPIARLIEAKKARGWTQHRIYSDPSGDYTRDFVSPEDADVPRTTSSRDATAASVISGPTKWGHRQPIPHRTRAARPTSIRCGRFWTPRPTGAAKIGIRG